MKYSMGIAGVLIIGTILNYILNNILNVEISNLWMQSGRPFFLAIDYSGPNFIIGLICGFLLAAIPCVFYIVTQSNSPLRLWLSKYKRPGQKTDIIKLHGKLLSKVVEDSSPSYVNEKISELYDQYQSKKMDDTGKKKYEELLRFRRCFVSKSLRLGDLVAFGELKGGKQTEIDKKFWRVARLESRDQMATGNGKEYTNIMVVPSESIQ